MEEVSENSENIHISTKESTMRIDLMKIMMKVWLIASTLATTVSWSHAQQSTDTNPAIGVAPLRMLLPNSMRPKQQRMMFVSQPVAFH